jgi:hypothetical protein
VNHQFMMPSMRQHFRSAEGETMQNGTSAHTTHTGTPSP